MDTTYLAFICKGVLIAQHAECCSQACSLLAMLFLISWVQAEHLQNILLLGKLCVQLLFTQRCSLSLKHLLLLQSMLLCLLLPLLQQLIFQPFMLVLLLLLPALLLILHLIMVLLIKLSHQ